MTENPFSLRVTALVHIKPPSIHSGGQGNELVTMRTVVFWGSVFPLNLLKNVQADMSTFRLYNKLP